jgi:hypothetical protein
MLSRPARHLGAVAAKSRYFHRAKMFEEDEIEARWPGKLAELQDHSDLAADGRDGRQGLPRHLPDAERPEDAEDLRRKNKQWCVVETWWPQIEPGWVVVNEQNGLLEEKGEEEFAAMKEQRRGEQRAHIEAMMRGQPPMVQAQPGDGHADDSSRRRFRPRCRRRSARSAASTRRSPATRSCSKSASARSRG